MSRRTRVVVLAAVAATVLGTVGLGAATAAPATRPSTAATPLARDDTALIRLRAPSLAAVRALVAQGYDLDGPVRAADRGTYTVDAVVSGARLARLQAQGFRVLQVIERSGDGTARYQASVRAERARVAAGLHTVLRTDAATGAVRPAAVDTLHFLQAYWWRSGGRLFLGVEVATTAYADPDNMLSVTWRTADGHTGSFPLYRFIDDREYQYDYNLPQPVPAQPVSLVATSTRGGTTSTRPTRWPNATPPKEPATYQKDFIRSYMTPEDIRTRIARLARQYPQLVDVINLPNQTHGYRRTATAVLGEPTAAVVVESVEYGDQGFDGVRVRTVDPGAPSRPLSVTYQDRLLTVSLATGADGSVISTTDAVAAAIQATYPQVFRSFVRAGQTGRTMPVAGPVALSDGLQAPASVPRAPWTVQALRIGVHRDGSRIGVLAYSQEHAREWAVPLVTLEFAERLLANYATDPETHKLLNDVDVFVVPTVNPDGANYSFNDFNFQRKNMDNHCGGTRRDPNYRDDWGVDVNRNYAVGSLFDGYYGASPDCLSEVYAGSGELSEAESRNVIALARAHPNIKFAMNVHSYGGYFMWPPGAYKADGRITLPRPSIQQSAEFLRDARQIVGAIASERGTVTWPAQTGPVADVLYSAAGNSADELYYENNIYAWDFEVGNDLWNPTKHEWEGVGFQPPYSEAHAEAMEYASGLVQLVRVAAAYRR